MADECYVKSPDVWFNKFLDNYFIVLYGRISIKNIFGVGGMMAA